MTAKEMVRKAYKEMRTHEVMDVELGGGTYEIIEELPNGVVILDPKDKKWKLTGDKRVMVEEYSETKKCFRCGREFEPSKFTPYQKYCGECGNSRGPNKPDREEVECETCGQTWERSKFLPYIKVCPACTKAAKLARDKDKRAAKK